MALYDNYIHNLPHVALYDNYIHTLPHVALYDNYIRTLPHLALYDNYIHTLPHVALYDNYIHTLPHVALYDNYIHNLPHVALYDNYIRTLPHVALYDNYINTLPHVALYDNYIHNLPQVALYDKYTFLHIAPGIKKKPSEKMMNTNLFPLYNPLQHWMPSAVLVRFDQVQVESNVGSKPGTQRVRTITQMFPWKIIFLEEVYIKQDQLYRRCLLQTRSSFWKKFTANNINFLLDAHFLQFTMPGA